MPIVEPPSAGYPLSQGDILRGVTLHATKRSWNEKGGDGAKAPFSLCMVISRPCVITNKNHVTVVAVEKYPTSTPREIDSFAKVLDFMKGARDGTTAPDVFYLGQLPDAEGRYCARLDSFHDIEIPSPTDSAARAAFVAKARVASLNPDFLRALHSRLFEAFADMGFDDHAWPSTQDLTWIVTQGQADISKLDGEVKQQQALKLSRDAEGKKFDDKLLKAAETALAELKPRVQAYETELERRSQRVTLPTTDPSEIGPIAHASEVTISEVATSDDPTQTL